MAPVAVVIVVNFYFCSGVAVCPFHCKRTVEGCADTKTAHSHSTLSGDNDFEITEFKKCL
jgi:hypothetical protein